MYALNTGFDMSSKSKVFIFLFLLSRSTDVMYEFLIESELLVNCWWSDTSTTTKSVRKCQVLRRREIKNRPLPKIYWDRMVGSLRHSDHDLSYSVATRKFIHKSCLYAMFWSPFVYVTYTSSMRVYFPVNLLYGAARFVLHEWIQKQELIISPTKKKQHKSIQ